MDGPDGPWRRNSLTQGPRMVPRAMTWRPFLWRMWTPVLWSSLELPVWQMPHQISPSMQSRRETMHHVDWKEYMRVFSMTCSSSCWLLVLNYCKLSFECVVSLFLVFARNKICLGRWCARKRWLMFLQGHDGHVPLKWGMEAMNMTSNLSFIFTVLEGSLWHL